MISKIQLMFLSSAPKLNLLKLKFFFQLFPPYASFDYKGHQYSGSKNVSNMRNELVSYLESMAMTPPAWPKLEPFT